jgi:hypothetical protein
VVPASGVTGKSEASEEFCKEVDAAARWNRHREQRRGLAGVDNVARHGLALCVEA